MSGNKRPLLIIVGLVFAVAIGLFAYTYLTQPRTPASATVPRTVVVASRPIPARTQIDPTMLQTDTRPADQVEPGTFQTAFALTGDVALTDIPQGAALTAANAGRPAQLSSPVHLQKGMRAMSIPVDEVKGVSGLLEPGDRVDVYAVTQRQGNVPSDAFAIMRDLVVIAVGGSTAGIAPGPNGSPAAVEKSVTLQVTPAQAKTLALADLNTNLRLALRPPDEPMRSQQTDRLVLEQPQTMPVPVTAAGPAAPLPAVQPAPAARTPDPNAIQFILGDKVQIGSP